MDRISIAGAAAFAGGKLRCTLNVPQSCFTESLEIQRVFLETFRPENGFCEDQPWPKGKRIDFCVDIDSTSEKRHAVIGRFNEYFLPYLVTGDDVETDLDYGCPVGNGTRLMFGSRFVAP